MLYIRKLKPTVNKQTEGEIIKNAKLETSIEIDNILKNQKIQIQKLNIQLKKS